jgi:uncharacterized RDD family membrane protein YckC
MFWVARVADLDATEARSGARTIIRGRTIGAEGKWVDIARLGSRVTSLASRGTELAALLDSGNWMLLWHGGSAMGALPEDGARLLLLASGADSIFAIGSGGRVVTTTTSSTAPIDVEPRGELGLYRLDRGRWRRQGWLPREISVADLPMMSMAVVGSSPMLAIRRSDASIMTLRRTAGGWDELEPLSSPDVIQHKLLSDGGRAWLWTAPPQGPGTLYLLGRQWLPPRTLEMNDPPRAGEPRTIAFAGNNLRLLFIRDRRILEQTFDLDGTPKRQPTTVPASGPKPDTMPNRILTLVAAAMLMVVVIGSLRRGGGAAPASAALTAGITPAPLLLRLLAGIVDALPLLVPMWFIFSDIDPDADEVQRATTSWQFYAALGGYLLYTWLCEAFFTRTIGKMLFGLRVVSLDGSRPSPGALFARNALRLVDVTMLAVPMVLVLLTPLRQRIGDIAARTVVVVEKPATDESSGGTEQDQTPSS